MVEISGASGSGKTFLCLKMTSLALIEQSVGVIYVDTTNYINNENLNIVLKVRAEQSWSIEFYCRPRQRKERREDARVVGETQSTENS